MKCTCSEIEAAHGHHFGCPAKVAGLYRELDQVALVHGLQLAHKRDQVDSLAALVRQLAQSLKKHHPESDLAKRAVDYLKRHGLQGSPLRTEAQSTDPDEDAYVIGRLGKLLAEIAIIVNGPEPPLTRWSYHDLPDKVRALKALNA